MNMLRIVVRDHDRDNVVNTKIFKVEAKEIPEEHIKEIFTFGFNTGEVFYPPNTIKKISIFYA